MREINFEQTAKYFGVSLRSVHSKFGKMLRKVLDDKRFIGKSFENKLLIAKNWMVAEIAEKQARKAMKSKPK